MEFEKLPISSHCAGYDNVPYEEIKPTRIRQDKVQGWQEDSKGHAVCDFNSTRNNHPEIIRELRKRDLPLPGKSLSNIKEEIYQ